MSTQLGVLSLVAIAIYAAALLLQAFFTHLAQHFRDRLLRQTDARVRATAEALAAIRLLKLACLEDVFSRGILSLRATELKLLQKFVAVLTLGVDVLAAVTPSFTAVLCFSLFPRVAGKPLSATVAFTSLSLLKLLDFPFAMLPASLASLAQFK